MQPLYSILDTPSRALLLSNPQMVRDLEFLAMTLEQVMGDLGNPDVPIRHTDLVQLAGLPRARVASAAVALFRAPVERRRELIDRMSELADNNIELDFTAVFRACLRDRDADARARAARGLWDSEDRTIIRPLIGLLTNDDSALVRAAAATALSKFAELAGEGKLTRRDSARISDALLERHTRRRCGRGDAKTRYRGGGAVQHRAGKLYHRVGIRGR